MITQEKLKEILSYDPLTGLFTWKVRDENSVGLKIWNTRYANTTAGTICPDNRIVINIRTPEGKVKRYMAHRLAWLYEHGYFPLEDLDHIDMNPRNNAISNLRLATRAENLQNKIKAHKNNSTKLLGVHTHRNKFRARIRINNKEIHLGIFNTKEEASLAYITAKQQLHPFGNL